MISLSLWLFNPQNIPFITKSPRSRKLAWLAQNKQGLLIIVPVWREGLLLPGRSKFDVLLGNKAEHWHRIVGITHRPGTDQFTIFRRLCDDSIAREQLKSTAYMLVDDPAVLRGLPVTIKELAGPHSLRYVAVFADDLALQNGKRQIEEAYRQRYADGPGQHYWWKPAVPALQFRTGITSFKGMQFDEVKVMSLDIETFTSHDKYFSDASDKDDRVIIISLCTNRGKQWLLTLQDDDEAALLRALNALVRAEDPDVIVGHNLLGFDLPYLATRADQLGIKLQLGRDGGELRRRAQRNGSAAWEAAGRHLVDTLPALISYDFTSRTLPSYQLKEAVWHFGLSSDRRDFDRSRISEMWQNQRDDLLTYAMNDAEDSLKLYRFLMPASFFQAQILPFPFQEVCTMGTGTKVDNLIIRNYLLSGQALPLKGNLDGAMDSGGLTEALELGWVENVVKADAASLYPSICLRYGLQPRHDHLGQFLATLRELTGRRLQAKDQLKLLPRGTTEHMALDAWQGALKILINSYYGMLGTGRLHFSDPETAQAITEKGQLILKQMVADVRESGGLAVEIDTDGIYFVMPEDCLLTPADFVEQVLNNKQDDGIRIECDGVYQAMYSYAPKNYLLVAQGGVTRKGVVFRSRRLYGVQDEVIGSFAQHLAEGKLGELAAYYRDTRRRIQNGDLTKDEVLTYAPVRDDLEQYPERLRRGGSRNRAYDLVVNRPDRDRWVERSRIQYYHRQGGQLALAEDFIGDYDIKVYLDLLAKTAEKFQYAFPPQVFDAIISCAEDPGMLSTWHFSPNPDLLAAYAHNRKPKLTKLSLFDQML